MRFFAPVRFQPPGASPPVVGRSSADIWGGVGHQYLKKKFYKPFIEGKETATRFIPATVYDNRKVNKGYRANLEQLTGWKRKAWLDGSPDVLAGQFFSTFRADIHTKPAADIHLMPTARFWCSLDYGFTHYTACYLLMEYDSMIHVLAEHAARKQAVQTHATAIKAMLERFGLTLQNLDSFVAGSDVFAQRGAANGETIADQYKAEGIRLTEANTERINGAAQILKLLGDEENDIAPQIVISRNCVRLIECLPILEHDPNRPEDVKKVDTDENGNGGDDFYDAARYGIMARKKSVGVYL